MSEERRILIVNLSQQNSETKFTVLKSEMGDTRLCFRNNGGLLEIIQLGDDPFFTSEYELVKKEVEKCQKITSIK